MNLSTKTMPWMVASLLAVTSIFGQNQNQGGCAPQPPVCKPVPPPRCGPLQAPQQPMNCAYNAPAEINTGIQGDINFFASASFLYWQPSQDNMGVGLTTNNQLNNIAGSEQTIRGSFIDMNFKFRPGFKVGLGMNLQTDDWDGYAEYTRVHGHHSVSSNGPLHPTASPSILATWGSPSLIGLGGQLFSTVSASYNNHLDFGDAEMGRKYYVGKSLIFRSAWGARAAWILQNIHVAYENRQATRTTSPTGRVVSFPSLVNVYQRSHSWGVGPRAGLCMDWMLGSGVRFFGSGYGDILYTKYKIQDKSVILPLVTNGAVLVGNPISLITRDKVRVLRTHLDFEAGFGWGSYFDNNNWHIDFSAAYGWQVFFDQNMFRHFEDDIFVGTNTLPHGSLFVQGLTATLRVDF